MPGRSKPVAVPQAPRGAAGHSASVEMATRDELTRLGAVESVEGQVALNLAKVLDERVGVQGGGIASSAKQLREVMAAIRESHRETARSGLALIRDAAV